MLKYKERVLKLKEKTDALYSGIRFVSTTRTNVMGYSNANPRTNDGYYEYLLRVGIASETGRSKKRIFCTLDLKCLELHCKNSDNPI